jgi:hypothetical protein
MRRSAALISKVRGLVGAVRDPVEKRAASRSETFTARVDIDDGGRLCVQGTLDGPIALRSRIARQVVGIVESASADVAGFVGRDAEHAQQRLGHLIGRMRVVAFGMVVQQLPEAQRGACRYRQSEVGVANGEPAGLHARFDVAAGGKTRYRFEFRLRPTETVDHYRDVANLHPLVAPWTNGIPVEQLQIVRVAEYTFRARVADRWRDRRIFLLGDAAHQTPPFIGQGLCAGVRDAANLSWKLAGVLDDVLPERVLDTYEAERKPHATAMIRLAKLVGTVMTEGGEFGNLLRRVLAPRLNRIATFSSHILNSETPPLKRTELAARRGLRSSLPGRLCPNAQAGEGRRFDALVGGQFAVVTSDKPSPRQAADLDRLGAVLVTTSAGTDLHQWLRGAKATSALVRPDGTVMRAGRNLTEVCSALASVRVSGRTS